jgi:hypothetical protein
VEFADVRQGLGQYLSLVAVGNRGGVGNVHGAA